MNPTMMLTLLVAAWAAFAWSANRRWQLLKVGRSENRTDHIGTRLKVVYEYALVQKKMGYYPLAGARAQGHLPRLLVLLLRTLDPLGPRVRPGFQFLDLRRRPSACRFSARCRSGTIYEFLKDVFATLVLLGVAVFFYYRVIRPQKRMSLHPEGLRHPRHHRLDDGRRHALRRRVARAAHQLSSYRLRARRWATLPRPATRRASCSRTSPSARGRSRGLQLLPVARGLALRAAPLGARAAASSCSSRTSGSGRTPRSF